MPLALLGFARSWWKAGLGFILGAIFCFPLAQCKGEQNERAKWEAKTERMKAAAERLQRTADRMRDAAAQIDRARIARNRQEIDDVLKSIPDQATSARQRMRACIELRRQGASAAVLDAACGPAQPPRPPADPR